VGSFPHDLPIGLWMPEVNMTAPTGATIAALFSSRKGVVVASASD
jgi:hypothetical protein